MSKFIFKRKGMILLLFFTSFFFISLVGTISAVPPSQTNVNIYIGLDISFPKFDVTEQYQDYIFHFHVFNRSDGTRLDNTTTNCTFELYNYLGNEQVRIDAMDFEVEDWVANISGGNFTRLGAYQYLVNCQTITGDYGGFISSAFEVTPTGESPNLGFYILVLILSLGIIIFGATRNDPVVTMLGSFGLYFLGLYILFNGIVGVKDLVTTWAIGIIMLGLAMYVSIKSAHSLIMD